MYSFTSKLFYVINFILVHFITNFKIYVHNAYLIFWITLLDMSKTNSLSVFVNIDLVYLCCFQSHTNGINCLRFSPDGRWIASAGEDGLVKASSNY